MVVSKVLDTGVRKYGRVKYYFSTSRVYPHQMYWIDDIDSATNFDDDDAVSKSMISSLTENEPDKTIYYEVIYGSAST